ncbi:MAG: F0F1 ATP synthase subunit A [Deltaproteobacteria bacterium]|nr:F0F1 ATP synthase subunit A [Deltaproteobacteria bacterium]
MPENTTWFDFLIPGFQHIVGRFHSLLGTSFIARVNPSIQYFIGFLFVAVLVLLAVGASYRRISRVSDALIPDGRLSARTFLESVVELVFGFMEGVMGRKAATFFLPLIGTAAFLIFVSNVLGLIPGFVPPTSNLNTTVAMALPVFFATHIFGIREHGIHYFAHWFGPIRKWYALPLMLLLFAIEVVSHLARLVSLSMRLMGNMAADHMVITLFTIMVPFIVPLPMLALGLFVCILQTAVFCILSMIYIGMAISHEEQ